MNFNLNADKVRELLFPLPPVNEQHRIVEKIDHLMSQCDRLEKLRTERDHKQTSLLNAVMAKIE